MTAGRIGTGRIYYGWIMVAICMFALMLTTGSTMNAFGLYVLPVSEAFGLSRASMNTGLILMNAGSAISALIIGRLIDRYPARLIMGGSGYALGASLVALGLSHNLWLSATILAIPVGLGMTGIGNLTSPTLVARWFTVHRGRALAITMMGMSVATIVVAPPVAWLIDQLGWRHSLITLGIVVAVLITLLLPLVRNGPGPDDHEIADGDAAREAAAAAIAEEDVRLSPRQLLAFPRFWAIGLSTALAMAIFQAMLISLVPIGREIGFSTTKAASLISVIGIAGISGKLMVAWLADRFDRALLLTALYAMLALAGAVMLFADSYPLLVAACLLIGLAAGATMPLYLALLADQFGAKSFGTGNGMITFSIAVISAVAVRYSGEVYDRTGGYDLMFYTFIAIGIASALLMATLRRGAGTPELAPAE
ncbi:MFS transporter [Novosphingobium album (ex Liu et al. 2023)]|uniref:MFS transporter n=1 Tax=Novosphingobium album (ex Liu et al. 2023) TaxID=3031130 RepID=A0ABT5WUI7_9SPHN|nr:MFS transporter [Novosphingobium album (ex Liu et al. 2023)]MDE8653565.1 MFS transporter [Novosphingobium album (ex Liu et al. 2023)]